MLKSWSRRAPRLLAPRYFTPANLQNLGGYVAQGREAGGGLNGTPAAVGPFGGSLEGFDDIVVQSVEPACIIKVALARVC